MKQPLQRALLPHAALCFLLMAFCCTGAYAQIKSSKGIIAATVAQLKQKGVFTKETALFKQAQGVIANAAVISAVKKYMLVDVTGVETIEQAKPDYLSLSVPVNGRAPLKVLLYKQSISPNGFTLTTEKGMAASSKDIVSYRGSIDNDPVSVAALTFANNEVSGFISNSEGNYVVGKLGTEAGRHIIYNDVDLTAQPAFDCLAGSTASTVPESPASSVTAAAVAAVTTKCVNWYWETDYDLFVNKGSLANVNAYMQAVFNQMATLYANDGITVLLRTLFVWTTEDPYTGTGTSDYLTQFGNYRTSFDGDLAHLIGLKGGGGIAWIDGACKTTKYKMAYSGVSSTYQTVPTYSWTVECITHEQGHLLGSQHTHDCSWNGNNTKIDGCGDNAGYASGTCANPGNPAGGGTIMSYCHLLQGVGINFNLGFGPQPTERITNTINAATCLVACSSGCTSPVQPGTITGTAIVCAASSQTYSVAAVSGATAYTWALPSGWTGTTTTNSITVTVGTTSGNVSVIAENACGKSTARTLAVTASTIPSAPATVTGNTTVCSGTSQTYTASAVAGATSYTWTIPSGWTGTSTTNTITVTTGTAGGQLTVRANNTCGQGTVKTVPLTISSVAPAQPAAIAGNTAICAGSSQTYSVAAVSGAASYAWSLPSGWTGTSTTNSITATAGAAGNISIAAVSGCGASAARTLAVTLTSGAPAQPGTITGNTAICAGSSQTYSVAAVSGAASYIWTLPSGWSGTSTTNSITATAGAAGNISVTAVSGCGSGTARTLAVTASPLPATPGAITVSGGTATVCTGNTRTYTTPLVAGVTYNWTTATGVTITSGQNTNSITVSFTSSFVSGSSLTVRAANSCGNSTPVSIVINKTTSAAPGAISGSGTSCPSRYKQYSVASVSGATSYQWAIPTGYSFWGSSTGRSVWVRIGTVSGSITVKAITACGTSAASSKAVTVSCTSGIETMTVKEPAAVYPNPATNMVTVRFSAEVSEPYTISLVDVTGRVITKTSSTAFAGSNQQSLSVSKYLPGAYFVMIQGKTIKEVLKLNIK